MVTIRTRPKVNTFRLRKCVGEFFLYSFSSYSYHIIVLCVTKKEATHNEKHFGGAV